MNPIRRHSLVALVVVGVLVVGVGAAFAATQAGPPWGGGQGRMAQGGGGMGPGGGYGVMAGGVVMDAAAEYIGISEADLVAARQTGKSLAQIALAHGKTVAGLKQALVTAFKANLDKAVAAGRITTAQATQALATFQSQVQTIVDRTATGPMNGRGAGMGRGPCGGTP